MTDALSTLSEVPHTGPSEVNHLVHLPLELVLLIVEAAAVANRDNNLVWALSLSLISRAARACALPLLYGLLVIEIFGEIETPTTGWDRREYWHRKLALLSWLLCNPNAAPRSHIKQLIFRHDSAFDPSDIAEQSKSFSWEIDYLIVEYAADLESLLAAGLRGRRVIQVDPYDDYLREGNQNVYSVRLGRFSFSSTERVYISLWTCPADSDDSSDDTSEEFDDRDPSGVPARQSTERRISLLIVRDLEPGTSYRHLEVPLERQGHFAFIELGSQHGYDDLTASLLLDITQVGSDKFQFVLVCDEAYTPGGRVLEQAVVESAAGLNQDIMDRLWIKRMRHDDRQRLLRDPFRTVARLASQGRDPRDSGRRWVDTL